MNIPHFVWRLILVFLSIILYNILNYEVNIMDYSSLDKYPFTYGNDMCQTILDANLKLTMKDNFTSIMSVLLSPKPVIETELNGVKVVIKMLATKDEFSRLDHLVSELPHPSEISVKLITSEILRTLNTNYDKGKIPKLHICPAQVDIYNFLNPLIPNKSSTVQHIHVWTSLMLNPEPLIAQILMPPTWPVPKYFGSCGRFAVFEYSGEIVSNHYNSPWLLRAEISFHLLEAAMLFTFGHPQFAFYLTDISPDNVAVDLSQNVKFIDMENIIVVDKEKFPYEEESKSHTSIHSKQENGFTFYPTEICRHQISDHNVYGICKEILYKNSIFPEGILHSPPHNLRIETLNSLILECIETSVAGRRFVIAREIQDILSMAFEKFESNESGRRQQI